MATDEDVTVWFPKDSLLFVVVTIPVWGIAGLVWGLVMALLMGGWLIVWLFGGVLWGAAVWFFFSLMVLITCRELSTSIPLHEEKTFSKRLGETVKRLRYTVEKLTSTRFVCKPKRWRHGLLGLLFSFEYTKLHVRMREENVELTGPAWVVKKVRKKLLANTPT